MQSYRHLGFADWNVHYLANDPIYPTCISHLMGMKGLGGNEVLADFFFFLTSKGACFMKGLAEPVAMRETMHFAVA